jgi:hypothetical protein
VSLKSPIFLSYQLSLNLASRLRFFIGFCYNKHP